MESDELGQGGSSLPGSFTILAPWLTYAQADIFRERQVDPVWFAYAGPRFLQC